MREFYFADQTKSPPSRIIVRNCWPIPDFLLTILFLGKEEGGKLSVHDNQGDTLSVHINQREYIQEISENVREVYCCYILYSYIGKGMRENIQFRCIYIYDMHIATATTRPNTTPPVVLQKKITKGNHLV